MEYEVQRWIDYAEKDLAVAKHLWASFHPKPLEIICYHCQQAAEKAIKAVYIAKEIPGGLPRKHDLSFLLEQMKNHVSVSDDLLDIADSLNSFGVIVRYPNDIQIDESTVIHALQFADTIMAWSENILMQ